MDVADEPAQVGDVDVDRLIQSDGTGVVHDHARQSVRDLEHARAEAARGMRLRAVRPEQIGEIGPRARTEQSEDGEQSLLPRADIEELRPAPELPSSEESQAPPVHDHRCQLASPPNESAVVVSSQSM